MLRTAAIDPIVLADSQCQLTKARITAGCIPIQRIQVLDGTLSEGLLTDDNAAVVVLDGRRKYLGS